MIEDEVGIGLVRPDLLGTYGDVGNAVVLAQRLNWRDVPARIVPLGPGAAIPPEVRVMVIGGGEDRALVALLADHQLMANVVDAIDRGVAVLAICAGLQILGKRLIGPHGIVTDGLGVLDCVSDRLERRAVGECLVRRGSVGRAVSGAGGSAAVGGDPDAVLLTGFENHRGNTTVGPGAEPLGRVELGVGNGDGTDGAVSGKVIATYLHGPVLARNPALADRLLESVLGPLAPLPLPVVDRLHAERLAAAPLERREADGEAGIGQWTDRARRRLARRTV